MAKYLDEAGLSRLVEKIKEKFIGQSEVIDIDSTMWMDQTAAAAKYEAVKSAIERGKPIFIVSDTWTLPALRALVCDGYLHIEFFEPSDMIHEQVTTLKIYENGSMTTTVSSLIEDMSLATQGNVGLKYDEEKKAFYVSVNGVAVGAGVDATPFIKDGMLEDVDTIEVTAENLAEIQAVKADASEGDKLIKFVWNTDGGGKVDYIKTSDIAVDPDTANTEVSEDIIIAGGPLAEEVKSVFSAYKDADGNTVIPKDMTLQEVLTLLVCKELWPTAITTSEAKLVSTVAAPTITMETKTVEVGTAVAYSVKNGASGYTATPHKASGFTYGYSADDDNSKDSSATSASASFGEITIVDDSVSMVVEDSVSGNEQTTSGSSAAGSATISGEMVVTEGVNTVTAQSASATYRGECSALPTYYGCSNTGKTNDGTKNYPSAAKEAVTLTSTSVVSTQAKKSVTAQYKYFVGYSDKTEYSQFDSASVRALTAKSGFMTKDGTTTIVASTATAVASDGRSIVVAVPSKYTLKTITNGLGADIKANFTSVGTVKVKTGGGSGAEEDYTVYVYPITNGAVVEFKGLTVGK